MRMPYIIGSLDLGAETRHILCLASTYSGVAKFRQFSLLCMRNAIALPCFIKLVWEKACRHTHLFFNFSDLSYAKGSDCMTIK